MGECSLKNFHRNVELVTQSGLFDTEWYLSQYPDVKVLGMDPLEHFLKYGWLLGRDPSLKFSTEYYIEKYPDIKEAEVNPLIHYLAYGLHEARKIDASRCKARRSSTSKASNKQRKQLSPLIVYHSHNLKWQGAPNSLFEIAKGIQHNLRGYRAILTASEMGPIGAVFEQAGIPFVPHTFPSKGGQDPDEMQQRLEHLAEFYIECGAALVHANTLQTFFAILAARIAKIPVVWNVRESEDPKSYFDYLPPYLRSRALEAMEIANAVVFVSKTTLDLWKSYMPGLNYHLIHNGVDIDRLLSSAYSLEKEYLRIKLGFHENEVVFLCVGTICPRKNQLELLKAYAMILARGIQNAVLVFVGANDSAYSKQIKRVSENINRMGGKIKVLSETFDEVGFKELAMLFKAADVFALTSTIESYPRVVIEALSFGLPVISSICFGTVEQITDGESGLLYPQGNIKKLAGHLELLACNNELRKALSFGAKKSLASLPSYKIMLSKYQTLYKSVLT